VRARVPQGLQRAAQLQRQGKLDKAAEAYQAILVEQPHHFEATHQLGVIRYQQGIFAESLHYLSAAVSLNPADISVLTNFAVILQSLGQTEEALATYDRVLVINPDLPEALYNRGNALRELKRPEKALESFDRAIAINPQFAEAHNNRGNALHELNRPQDALASYDKALAIKPRLLDALYNRGNLLKELNRPAEALASYKKALAINSKYAEAHVTCGNLLESLDRPAEALASYDRAIGISPDVADVHIVHGDLLKKLDRPAEALASYNKAVAVSSDHAAAHDRRGLVLTELGRLAEATSAHENAIALAPRKAAFYYNLTALRQLTPGDPLARAMRKLSRDMTSLDWEEQTLLHFALAKTFADNADYKRSFRHLLDGNALKRKHIHYDETATLAANDGLRAAFTNKLMQKNQGAGEPSRVPVFVVGMPRSGTTLVEQLLCSHPEIFGAGEIPEFFNAAVEVGGPHLEALHFYEESSEAVGDQLRQIGASYMARIGRKSSAAERIVNKMPDNFRLAGLIHLALPNARIIHIRRDPVDTCLSCFSTLFVGENVPFAYDLAGLGRYYRSYDSLMAHWNEVLPPNVMLDVQYEELVADVEGQGRRMIAHCGLEWDPRCLNFHQTERPVRTASAVQVRQPIYKTSVGRGRKYEAFLGPLFSTLGPTLSYHPSEGETRAVAAGPLEKLANVVRTMIRRISSSPMS
jgi:tetratricopeptide (TPR) repeat protein